MKNIFLILAFITLNASAQTKIKYAPNRTSGDVIVTDVAWRAGEFLQIPTTTVQTPSIGSYVDSTGRIFYSRFDSTLLIRNNGTWFRYFNSNKINAMDALVMHLAGTETSTGNKTFNGNTTFGGTITAANDIIWNNNTGYGLKAQDGTRFLSYTPTFGAYMPKLMLGNQVNLAGAPQLAVTGKIRATDSIISQTGIRLTNDLVWNTDGGFGLRGSDGVRYVSYTTAGGVVIGTSATPTTLARLTTAGVVTTSSAGLLSSVARLTSANIDTGRATAQIVTGGSLNKVSDSITSLFASGIYLPTAANVSNTSAITIDTAQWMRVGNVVTVSGRIAFTNTLNSPSQISITLPVATIVSSVRNVAGVGNENIAMKSAIIRGRTGTNDALLEVDGLNSSTYTIYYTYTYRIL